MTKVFISSTDFDLLDVRAELEHRIREMRLQPVLSGRPLSSVAPLPDANSIETCLAHVRQCDYFLCILDRRYGPSLGPAGFEDVSATHLEYKEARNCSKPIFFYVRDRLDAEYTIWKRNKNIDVEFAWCQKGDAKRMFELLDEHKQLSANATRSNWREIFRDSVDLKALVARDLREPAGYADLDAAIRSNSLPLIDVITHVDRSNSGYAFSSQLENLGNVPAFSLRIKWDGLFNGVSYTIPMLGPRQKHGQSVLAGRGMGSAQDFVDTLRLSYQLPIGHHIDDVFEVKFKWVAGGSINHGATLVSREFRLAEAGERAYILKTS